MSICSRCGASFGCAMLDGGKAPCWCTRLPPVMPVPAPLAGPGPAPADAATGCWCPACLEAHIAAHIAPVARPREA